MCGTIGWRTKNLSYRGAEKPYKAEASVVELLRSSEWNKNQRHLSFHRYAEPYFDWEHFPHICKLREEGKSINRRYVKIERQRLEKHILLDPFTDERLSETTRADALDL